MEKKDIISKIVETIKTTFEQDGFKLKMPNKFVKRNGDSLYIYEICVTNLKTHFSLHLKLKLQNKSISTGVNNVLKKVLKNPGIKYPSNFSNKVIEDIFKGRTSNKDVYGLTDWRLFKEDEQTLNDFNERFSIWFSTFEKLENRMNWQTELLQSVDYAKSWFLLVDNDAYLIKHTDYVAMYLLKKQNNTKGVEAKYKEIYNRMKTLGQDTQELELFYKYLFQEN
ncbi:hypothetical protein [Prevotella pallens]|jgi:hypothetical protein|uniref:hypothetical protein n=1 Tax=Prevotella pallens TaxID=60133 RepID=UPI001CAFD22A|nr:hypothetical protein [Prevotella pallens]MBF1509263.1 hypothetical protein [Prevotella pallens]MBF1511810.1 hypothetical protein [Prevotella pallens]